MAASRGPSCSGPRARRYISEICSPTLITGFSADSASWKIIAIRWPRISRYSSSGRPISSCPRQPDRPAGDTGRRRVEDAHDRLRGHRLAGAGLAQDRDRLAAIQREGHAVDRAGLPVAGVELDEEILDVEQSAHGHRSPPQLRVEGLADGVAEQDERQHGQAQEDTRGTAASTAPGRTPAATR